MKIVDHLYWYSKDKPVSHFLGHGFTANVYALDQGDEIWLVDAGIDHTWAGKANLQSDAQGWSRSDENFEDFITHAHLDHAQGVVAFKKVANSAYIIPELEDERSRGGEAFFWDDQSRGSRGLLKDFYPLPLTLVKIGVRYAMGSMPILIPDQIIHDNEIIHGKNLDLQCVFTPGHTVGHCCFYIPQLKVLFGGDLMDPSFDHKASLNFCTADFTSIYASLERVRSMDIKVFCGAHTKIIYFGEEIFQEICSGTLAKLDEAKLITLSLLEIAGEHGMRLKDFNGKFPKATWMLQDQMCVPFTVIKTLEPEGHIRFDGQRFYLQKQ